jgi:hypothetical protein
MEDYFWGFLLYRALPVQFALLAEFLPLFTGI